MTLTILAAVSPAIVDKTSATLLAPLVMSSGRSQRKVILEFVYLPTQEVMYPLLKDLLPAMTLKQNPDKQWEYISLKLRIGATTAIQPSLIKV